MAGLFDFKGKEREAEEKKEAEAKAAIEEELISLTENLADMRKQALAVTEEEKKLRTSLERKRAEIAQEEELAKTALSVGKESDARHALSRKVNLQEQEKELAAMYEEVHDTAKRMRDMHDDLVYKINEIKARYKMLLARKDAAEALEELNKVASSSAKVSEEMRAFEELGRESEEQLLRAEAMEEARRLVGYNCKTMCSGLT